MKLEFSSLRIEPAGMKISDEARALTNIEADLRIHVAGRMFFDEAMICVVELADALNYWVSSVDYHSIDFRYESMDDDEPNILCLSVNGNETKIYSAWQEFDVAEPIDTNTMIAELERFVDQVIARCRNELGVEVRHWIRGYNPDKPLIKGSGPL